MLTGYYENVEFIYYVLYTLTAVWAKFHFQLQIFQHLIFKPESKLNQNKIGTLI